MYRLRIELKSATCPAAGIGRPGYVDREVCFDDFGLPYIPGRRLKGLLRDAYEQVFETAEGGLPDRSPRLFGAIGDRQPGAVRFGTARLQRHGELANWINAAFQERSLAINRDRVIAHYTEIRRQTAIDTATEAPKRDTLRATRVLRRGLIFHALIDGLSDDSAPMIGLAAAALHFIGSSRTRGLGHVECRLEIADSIDAPATNDVTEAAIQLFEQVQLHSSIAGTIVPQQPALGDSNGSGEATNGNDESLLRYRLTLHEPALITRVSGDQNLVATRDFIPGSSIQGVFASRYLAAGPAADDEFHRLITGPSIRYLGAHPAIEYRGKSERSFPVPHSIRRDKTLEGNVIDLAGETTPPPVRRVPGWAILPRMRATGSPALQTKTSISYHHARPEDRRIGHALSVEQARARGVRPEQAGAFFSYEAIDSDQCFLGAILGARSTLETIAQLVRSGDTVRIGRSRNSQYGGEACWEWIDPSPVSVVSCDAEISGWKHLQTNEGGQRPSAGRLAITLLSPMLARNENGHFVPTLPISQIASALGSTIIIEKSFTRVGRWGGYFSHQRLPRQQVPSVEAGSVFIVHAEPEPAPEKLLEVARRSFGCRTTEGFGRISIEPLQQAPKLSGSPPKAAASPRAPTSAVAELAESLLRRQAEEAIAHDALETALATKLGTITGSLLHRLATIVRGAQSVEDIAKPIKEMRETAQKKMERCVVKREDKTLSDFLIGIAATKGDMTFRKLLQRCYDTGGWNKVFSTNPLVADTPVATDFRNTSRRRYILRYLSTLSWMKRLT